MTSWSIAGNPTARDRGNAFEWTWPLRRGNQESSIVVRISATAMSTSSSGLPELVVAARETDGRAALERVMAVAADWNEPLDGSSS